MITAEGIRRAASILLLVCTTLVAFVGTVTGTLPETEVRDTRWGTLPAFSDSTSAVFVPRPRPAWETAVLVPYWIVGAPFRVAYLALDQTVVGVDRLGIFGRPADYPGLPLPGGAYLMPSLALGELEGVTGGVEISRPELLSPEGMLFFQANTSSRNADEISGGLFASAGRGWDLQLGAGFEEVNLNRYYGLGAEARVEDLSYYFRRTVWAGWELDRGLGGPYSLSLRSDFTRVRIKNAAYKIEKSLGLVHAGDVPYGFPGESSGWRWRLALAYDSTDQTGRPERGGFRTFAASLFRSTDRSGLVFMSTHANIEHYFKLWHTKRTLALRGFVNRIHKIEGGEIPFTRLTTFQRPDELRGFPPHRFIGMGTLGLSAEYRWPIWGARGRDDYGVDAYIFSDIGQVFDRTMEIGLDEMKLTGGVGLRLIDSDRRLRARFEAGWSDEDVLLRFKFSQTFQYDPKGLLYGKNPTKVH